MRIVKMTFHGAEVSCLEVETPIECAHLAEQIAVKTTPEDIEALARGDLIIVRRFIANDGTTLIETTTAPAKDQ